MRQICRRLYLLLINIAPMRFLSPPLFQYIRTIGRGGSAFGLFGGSKKSGEFRSSIADKRCPPRNRRKKPRRNRRISAYFLSLYSFRKPDIPYLPPLLFYRVSCEDSVYFYRS
jgi:hypothetical protein